MARQQLRQRLVVGAHLQRHGFGVVGAGLDHLAQVQALHLRRAGVFVGAGDRQQERAEHQPQRVGERQCRVVVTLETRQQLADRRQQHLAVQPFLAAEVVVDRRHIGLRGEADLARRRARVALLGKQTRRFGEQALARPRAAVGGFSFGAGDGRHRAAS
jgi:hypothetical protein